MISWPSLAWTPRPLMSATSCVSSVSSSWRVHWVCSRVDTCPPEARQETCSLKTCRVRVTVRVRVRVMVGEGEGEG